MRKEMEHFINNPIYTITAEAMSNGRNNIEVVGKMLEAGIKFIQYREKEKPAKEKSGLILKKEGKTHEYSKSS